MSKMKPGTFTSGTVNVILKERLKSLLQVTMSSVKGTPGDWKQF